MQPWQVLKFKNPAGTKVIVLVADVYPGADAVSVTAPVELPIFWTYTGVLLVVEPAKTIKLTLFTPFTMVPRAVGLVDNRTLVGSPLETVIVSFPAGAATARLTPIEVCKS